MRTDVEAIYKRYRGADFMDRLNIYLQFPALRNDFLEIEQQEARSRPRLDKERTVSFCP